MAADPLAAMGMMLESQAAPGPMGGGEGGPPMPDDGGGDIVAGLVAENVQLRQLLGLGPNDPLPPVPGPGGGGGGGGAPTLPGM